MVEVLQFVCKICGKEINSLHKREFEYNVKAHKLMHKLRTKKIKKEVMKKI